MGKDPRAVAASPDRLERRLRALGCGDAVADLHGLVGVEPRYLLPYTLSAGRKHDPGPCEDFLTVLAARILRSPRSPRPLILRGRVLRVLDRKEESLAAFDRALKLSPGDVRARQWRGELLLHMPGGTARGVADLAAAASAVPDAPWPLVWAAAARLATGSGRDVLVALDAALSVSPRHVPALLLRAVARERGARLEDALADASRAAALAPDCVGVHALRGRLEARLGKDAAAAASFARAVRLEPDARSFYAALVSGGETFGGAPRGPEDLDAYIRRHPKAAWAYALRGDRDFVHCLQKRGPSGGRADSGTADLERAVKLDPTTPWIRACLGRSRVQEANLERAMKLDPNGSWRACLARARAKNALPGRGLRDLRAALALDPRCAWLHLWLGEAYRSFGRADEALACFRRAIALKPRFAQAHAWLGRARGEKARFKPAIAEFTRAIRIDCDCGKAYAMRGRALALLGRHAEAIADFDRALDLKPREPEKLRNLREESRRAVGAPVGARCVGASPAAAAEPSDAVRRFCTVLPY
ncbi:MAG: tetratricopeptide repeat protein [Elusimicrobiota bacterium]